VARTDFHEIACSIARSASIVGDPWALLILRDAALGLRRFEELQRDLGVATNVLSQRLQRLVDGGVLQRHLYEQRPDRYEYHLTDKGRDLIPALFALMAWGDRWESGQQGPPLLLRHHTCGEQANAAVTCDRCGTALPAESVAYQPGPGGRTADGTALVATVLSRRTGDASRGELSADHGDPSE
jgi:DNA-binding HxlR family transcriptional regulator